MSKLRGFNPFQSEILCENPEIIVNPRLPELLFEHGTYVLNGIFIKKVFPAHLLHLVKGMFSPLKTGVKLDDIKNCYVIDFDSGETYPIYFVVPCGHCSVCCNTKVSNIVRRFQYETMLYDSDPVHITLTYDEAHVPADYSVNLRHIQLWKKNLRIMIERSNYGEFVDGRWDPHRLRMAVAAEYGHKNTCRPHYHVILWNFKPIGRFDYRWLHNMCWLAWFDREDIEIVNHYDSDGNFVRSGLRLCSKPRCQWRLLTCMPINADYKPKGCHKTLREMGKTTMQAFGYVAKYFYKEDSSDVAKGRSPLFHTLSKSKSLGGIGAPFIDRHADSMRSAFHKEYYFLDRDGKMFHMAYDRYLLNRVFPSRYSSVRYKYRSWFKFLSRHIDWLSFFVKSNYEMIKQKVSILFPVIEVHGDNHVCYRSGHYCPLVNALSVRMAASRILTELYDYFYSLDYGHILYLDERRSYMIGRLFVKPKVVNVSALSIKLAYYKNRRLTEFSRL